MPAKPYRWHAIETVRHARKVRAHAELIEARGEQETLQRRVEQRMRALELHRAGRPPAPACAAVNSTLELQWVAAHAREHERVLLQLRRELRDAQDALAAQHGKVQSAQAALARARSEQRVIERHRKGLLRMTQRKQGAREQAELEDRVAQRSRRP